MAKQIDKEKLQQQQQQLQQSTRRTKNTIKKHGYLRRRKGVKLFSMKTTNYYAINEGCRRLYCFKDSTDFLKWDGAGQPRNSSLMKSFVVLLQVANQGNEKKKISKEPLEADKISNKQASNGLDANDALLGTRNTDTFSKLKVPSRTLPNQLPHSNSVTSISSSISNGSLKSADRFNDLVLLCYQNLGKKSGQKASEIVFFFDDDEEMELWKQAIEENLAAEENWQKNHVNQDAIRDHSLCLSASNLDTPFLKNIKQDVDFGCSSPLVSDDELDFSGVEGESKDLNVLCDTKDSESFDSSSTASVFDKNEDHSTSSTITDTCQSPDDSKNSPLISPVADNNIEKLNKKEILLFIPPSNGTTIGASEGKLKRVKKDLVEYVLDNELVMPTREGLFPVSDSEKKYYSWSHGFPDYTFDDFAYLKGRSRNHLKGSIEWKLENICRTFEMEATHKSNFSEWVSVNFDGFYFQINNGPRIPGPILQGQDMFGLLYLSQSTSGCNKNDNSHECNKMITDNNYVQSVLTEAINEGFPFEILEVYTELPQLVFSWRHWGQFTGCYKGKRGNGETIEMTGFGQALIQDGKLCYIHLYYKSTDLVNQIIKHAST